MIAIIVLATVTMTVLLADFGLHVMPPGTPRVLIVLSSVLTAAGIMASTYLACAGP